MKDDTRFFIRESIEISYWSRGACSYESAHDLTPTERDLWKEWLKERLDVESKRMTPCY